MTETTTTVTTSPFRRSHGTTPRGRGSWGFQASRTLNAFDCDCFGEVEFFQGTFTEASRAARQHFQGVAAFAAVQP
jgi:hypothetical protein